MNGDHNDGFARFFVDSIDIGTFDLHQRGLQNLAVTGLDAIAHTLTIVQLGLHNPHLQKVMLQLLVAPHLIYLLYRQHFFLNRQF